MKLSHMFPANGHKVMMIGTPKAASKESYAANVKNQVDHGQTVVAAG